MNKPVKPPRNAVPKFPPGYKVFPCKPGSKEPAFYGWAKEATDDPAQIEAWAIQYPSANWGLACGPSGLAVIDIDGEIGEQSLFAFELEHGQLPATREHSTPRGGRHLIYRGDIKPTVGTDRNGLGPKLDTRGGNSFILIAPSTFEDKPYTVTQDIPVALLPQFVADAAGPQHEPRQAPEGIELDTPANSVRAIEYLRHAEPAIEGNGGDEQTYKVSAVLHDLGISQETALDLMDKYWNGRNVPQWPLDELAVKVANGYRYAQNEAGSFAVPPVETRIPAEALDRLKAESNTSAPVAVSALPQQEGLLPSYMGGEIGTITPPRWLLNRFIPTPAVGIFFGKFGTFKTTTELDTVDAVLNGTKAFGMFDADKGDVAIVAGEGLSGLKTRIEARACAHGLTLARYPLLLVTKVPKADRPEEWVALAETIRTRGLKPKLIGIDHLSIMLSGQDQNDAAVATQAMQMAHELSALFQCTVLILAHAGKDGEREVRGSSAFLDNVDFAYELTRSEGSDIVKVRCAKMRDGEAPAPFYLKAESKHGAAIMTYANADDARRAGGKAVGLRAADVSAVLVAMGACPGGANEWTGSAGGIPTRVLATEIAAARHRGDEDGLEPSAREIDVLVMSLNRGAQGGPLDPYVVREKPRQWAVAPGPISTGADRA